VAIGAIALLTRKQVDALRQYPHLGAAFVQLEPAVLDGELEAGTELAALGLKRDKERCVDLLDMNASVLNRRDTGRSTSLRAAASGVA
jgi:hypothetical protein